MYIVPLRITNLLAAYRWCKFQAVDLVNSTGISVTSDSKTKMPVFAGIHFQHL